MFGFIQLKKDAQIKKDFYLRAAERCRNSRRKFLLGPDWKTNSGCTAVPEAGVSRQSCVPASDTPRAITTLSYVGVQEGLSIRPLLC